jgi:hypothetical protein
VTSWAEERRGAGQYKGLYLQREKIREESHTTYSIRRVGFDPMTPSLRERPMRWATFSNLLILNCAVSKAVLRRPTHFFLRLFGEYSLVQNLIFTIYIIYWPVQLKHVRCFECYDEM